MLILLIMKTTQILQRPFADVMIRQNHKTKMFRLTDLQGLFPDKPLNNWARRPETKAFMQVVANEEGLSSEEVISTHKSKNPEVGGTWVHPLVLLDYAMYVSPEFKYKALTWLHDNLCAFRDYAGDSFKEMNQACKEVLNYNRPGLYVQEARMVADLSGVALGERNKHSEVELRRMNSVQKINATLIRRGVASMSERRRQIKDFLALAHEANLEHP
jgi:hypothetical protein